MLWHYDTYVVTYFSMTYDIKNNVMLYGIPINKGLGDTPALCEKSELLKLMVCTYTNIQALQGNIAKYCASFLLRIY